MSHDEELEGAMHKIGVLRYELELLQSENKLVREESDRHYQLWVDSKAALNSSDHAVWTLAVENTRLKAEVERLRKAGDEMHRAIKVSDPILDWRIDQWNAAKEGKQS